MIIVVTCLCVYNHPAQVDCMDERVLRQDVPGASLKGRNSSDLKVPELKQWLECRAASTRGKSGLDCKVAIRS